MVTFLKYKSDYVTPHLETVTDSLSFQCDWALHHLQTLGGGGGINDITFLGLGRNMNESKGTQSEARKVSKNCMFSLICGL
jgi:hypothetical protein